MHESAECRKHKESMMEVLVTVGAIATTILAFAYLAFVMLYPERF